MPIPMTLPMRMRMKNFLIALALILMTMNCASAATFVYVSESRENAIKIYEMDAAEGTLREVDSMKVPGAPGSLGIDPQQKYLFASIRSTTSLGSFEIDAKSGRLKSINSTSLGEGANAAYVATDRTGKYLLSASYSGGRVVVHAITDGRLSEGPLQTVETEKTAHAAVFDLANELLFVPHVAPNAIYQFRFDANSGKLTAMSKAPGGADKAGPRHLAIHPNGKFAFSSDESGSSITLYSLNQQNGLKPLQTLSTLPKDYSERNSTADVKVHPSGKFVWVSNRGHDSLAGFAFDESAGKLQSLGQTPTEKTPRSFDIDPSGRFVFAGGEGSGKLASYRVEAKTGKLTPFHAYEVGKSLSWILIVKF